MTFSHSSPVHLRGRWRAALSRRVTEGAQGRGSLWPALALFAAMTPNREKPNRLTRRVTHHTPTRQLRFFLTAPSPCPYLPGRAERKVFAHLPMAGGLGVHDSLTQGGFRRSQNVAYRPACEGCAACVSARLPLDDYCFSRSERRVLARGAVAVRHIVEAEATREQFELLHRYLASRHASGGMADMTWADYVAMVEDTTVRTHLVEYRLRPCDGGPGALVACALVDELSDGLSRSTAFSIRPPPARALAHS